MKIGLLGYGYWGRNVARAMREGGFEVNVHDPDPVAMERAKKAGFGTADLGACEAIAVCTPPDTHASLIETCLGRGVPVWTEKPIACNLEESARLVRLSKERQVPIFVDHTFTFAPAVRILADQWEPLSETSRHIEAVRTHMISSRPGADIIGDLLPHDVSILLSCYMVPAAVRAVWRARDAFVEIMMIDRTTCTIYLSWNSAYKQRRMTFYADAGTIVYDHLNPHAPITVFRPESMSQDMWTHGTTTCPHVPATEPLSLAVKAFENSIKTKTDNTADALMVQRVVDAARDSSALGDWIQLRHDDGTSIHGSSP